MNIPLVDDHVSFCEGLIAAIHAKEPGIRINFESDAELVPPSLVGNSNFDLIIVDIMMPGIGGTELIRHLNAMGNFVPIVVMSSIDDIEEIQEIYSSGVLGFLPKYYSVEEIISALEQCQSGQIHVPIKLIPHINLGKTGERRRKIRVAAPNSDVS
ncbi:MAG: response regulator [Gammaproteobacteria bacterium]|nr:response regulator [Gammaproteobacteria bacterium]MDD9958051.1 response regulator [Gammaproteobacteria bacterium]